MINLDEIKPHNGLKTILRRLDFIVIDEISMVRADLMDAIDRTLKVNRNSDKPFGGVPMLLVGDFLQLPPIVEMDDLEICRTLDTNHILHLVLSACRILSPRSLNSQQFIDRKK